MQFAQTFAGQHHNGEDTCFTCMGGTLSRRDDALQRDFWSSKTCPTAPQEAADKCRFVWLVKQLNLDIDVDHLMGLIENGAQIVQSFVPPSPAHQIPKAPATLSMPATLSIEENEQPETSVQHPVKASKVRSARNVNEIASQIPEILPGQTAATHAAADGSGDAISIAHPQPSSDEISIAHPQPSGAQAHVLSGKAVVDAETGPSAVSLDVQDQVQEGLTSADRTRAALGHASDHAPTVGKVRSMLQPTEDGRMSSRPLAHVGGASVAAGKSFKVHTQRLMRHRHA